MGLLRKNLFFFSAILLFSVSAFLVVPEIASAQVRTGIGFVDSAIGFVTGTYNFATGAVDVVTNPTKALNDGAKWVAGGVQFLGSSLFWLAAQLFEFVFQFSIIDFGKNFNSSTTLGQSLAEIWTFFRDVGNIVLVGFFIYISLGIILNIQGYKDRRAIATVVIVALLLNFSLFFSKVVIETSNIFALQFSRQVTTLVQADGPQEGGAPATIVSFFSSRMNISTLTAAPTVSSDESQVGKTMFFAFFSLLIYIVFAGLFLYISVLLIQRTVVLILLMGTASLAFVALIVPAFSSKFWDWLSELIRQSFFAPLFMLFLWASMKFTDGVSRVGGLGGSTFENASSVFSTDMLAAILNYVLIAGLLYAGVRVAQSLSIQSGGLATKVSSNLLGAGFRVGAATAGFAGRRLGPGWAANKIANTRAVRKAQQSDSRVIRNLALLPKQIAKSSFDVRNTRAGKAAVKQAGLGLTGSGSKANFADVAEKAKKAAEAREKERGKIDLEPRLEALKEARDNDKKAAAGKIDAIEKERRAAIGNQKDAKEAVEKSEAAVQGLRDAVAAEAPRKSEQKAQATQAKALKDALTGQLSGIKNEIQSVSSQASLGDLGAQRKLENLKSEERKIESNINQQTSKIETISADITGFEANEQKLRDGLKNLNESKAILKNAEQTQQTAEANIRRLQKGGDNEKEKEFLGGLSYVDKTAVTGAAQKASDSKNQAAFLKNLEKTIKASSSASDTPATPPTPTPSNDNSSQSNAA